MPEKAINRLRKPVALTSRRRKAAHCDGNVLGPKQRSARQDRRRRLTHQHPIQTSFLNSPPTRDQRRAPVLRLSRTRIGYGELDNNGGTARRRSHRRVIRLFDLTDNISLAGH